MWVIKLGGSLIGASELPLWLDAIVDAARSHRIVLVTGGGPFADAVRDTQASLQIDDCTAHLMALHGMRQFALAIAAHVGDPAFASLVTSMEISSNVATSGLAIWDPLDPSLNKDAVPRDWRVTSDSLGLWLALTHQAALVLVKSRAPQVVDASTQDLAAESYVDEYFPVLQRDAAIPVWWLEKSQFPLLAEILSDAGHSDHRI